MIVKMNNKDEKFYNYMGKIFGSRLVQRQIEDRIYDDDGKEWYIYINDETVVGFISINKDVIKNVYALEEKYLKKLLDKVSKENTVLPSIVPKVYSNTYKDSNFVVSNSENYKNFVVISGKVKK